MGAQDLDTSSYQVSDLKDIEFNWENSKMDIVAVCRPSKENPFSPTIINNLSMKGSVENPNLLDEEEREENSAPTTTEFVRPTEPPRLQRSRAFGATIENVPDYVYRNLVQ